MKRHIFLSYSREDQEYANRLAAELKAKDYEIWQDTGRLLPGQNWEKHIKQAIREAWAVVVVESPRSENAYWVRTEIEMAQKAKIPIIPILLEGEHWPVLSDIQWCDVRGRSQERLPDAFYVTLLQHANRMTRDDSLSQGWLKGGVVGFAAALLVLIAVAAALGALGGGNGSGERESGGTSPGLAVIETETATEIPTPSPHPSRTPTIGPAGVTPRLWPGQAVELTFTSGAGKEKGRQNVTVLIDEPGDYVLVLENVSRESGYWVVWDYLALQPIWEIGQSETPGDFSPTAFDEFCDPNLRNDCTALFVVGESSEQDFAKELNDWKFLKAEVHFSVSEEGVGRDLNLVLSTLYSTHTGADHFKAKITLQHKS